MARQEYFPGDSVFFVHSKGIFPGTLRGYNGSTIGVQWGYTKLQNCADLRKALHMRCRRPPRLNCCCYTWCSASTDPIVFAIRLPQPSPNMPRQLQLLPLPMLFEVDQTHETMIKSHRIRSETDTSSHFVSHFMSVTKKKWVTGPSSASKFVRRDPQGTSCSVLPTCWGCWHSLPSSHTWINWIDLLKVPPWCLHGAMGRGEARWGTWSWSGSPCCQPTPAARARHATIKHQPGSWKQLRWVKSRMVLGRR